MKQWLLLVNVQLRQFLILLDFSRICEPKGSLNQYIKYKITKERKKTTSLKAEADGAEGIPKVLPNIHSIRSKNAPWDGLWITVTDCLKSCWSLSRFNSVIPWVLQIPLMKIHFWSLFPKCNGDSRTEWTVCWYCLILLGRKRKKRSHCFKPEVVR